jgi:putative transposase
VGSDALRGLLSKWPLEMPADWVEQVNRAETPAELDARRQAVKRSSPFGSADWTERTAKKLNLQWTLRPRGRPRVRPNEGVPDA